MVSAERRVVALSAHAGRHYSLTAHHTSAVGSPGLYGVAGLHTCCLIPGSVLGHKETLDL
jgi:hypothetical protein